MTLKVKIKKMYKKGFYDMFLRACGKWPSSIAVRAYNDGAFTTYTYSELFGICEYICQNLQQLKCTRGLIGLVSERNVFIPCVIAAAHKCSTVFMFLKPTIDLHTIINDTTFRVIIVITNKERQHQEAIRKEDKTIQIFNYTIKFYVTSQQKYVDYLNNDYSYIAQTSGSTGEPKRIQVPIQCIQPNINDLTKLFSITHKDIIYFSTPLTFDPSMIEILLACQNGASLLIAPENVNLLFTKKHSITFWQTTPSKFFQFSNYDIMNKILCANTSLKILALGGEPLNGIRILKQLKAHDNKTKIFTLYGVTEMSCWACLAELNLEKHDDDDIPLGNCLSETEIQIQHTQEEPDKHIGNIILVSDVRKCLLLQNMKKQIELNRIDTGDLGEIKNGTIYYRGRIDETIKRFGHKVNLQYIEKVAMQHPEVTSCSCVWIPKKLLLILYFSSDNIIGDTLGTFLKTKLKESSLPDKVIRIKKLPMNEHGKASKESLMQLFENSNETQDSFESLFISQLKTSISCSLSYDTIKDKDFFSIGGTSLQAVTLCNTLSMCYPEESKLILPLLLSYSTISKIMYIASKSRSKTPPKCSSTTKRGISVECEVDSKMFKKVTVKERNSIKELWSYDTNKCVDASPTLFDYCGKHYITVGSHSGKIVSLDAISGEVHGSIILKSRIEASVLCMAVSNQPLGVVGTYNGTIICFTLTDCTIVWQQNINSMIKSKAVFVNGNIYVGAYDGVLKCLDVRNGQNKHTLMLGNNSISADLAVSKKNILIATLSGLCACFNTRTNVIVWTQKLQSPVFASPVVYNSEKYVIFSDVKGIIQCFNAINGIKEWTFEGAQGYIFSSIATKQIDARHWRMVFGCHDKNIYCIDVKNKTPSLLWQVNAQSPVYSTPTIKSNYVIGASTKGRLFLINYNDGSVLHEYLFNGEIFSSPVVRDDCIYIGSRDDRLYALKYKIIND